MTREEIKDFCDMKAQLEPENEDIFKAIVEILEHESIFDKIFCIVHPCSIMSTPELEHKAIMQIAEMLEPLCLPESEAEDGKCK